MWFKSLCNGDMLKLQLTYACLFSTEDQIRMMFGHFLQDANGIYEQKLLNLNILWLLPLKNQKFHLNLKSKFKIKNSNLRKPDEQCLQCCQWSKFIQLDFRTSSRTLRKIRTGCIKKVKSDQNPSNLKINLL